MKRYFVPCFVLLIAATLILSVALRAEKIRKIELEKLEGDWEGTGEVKLPWTSFTMELTGSAVFEYDRKSKRLRTQLSGEKFMFNYTDSGYFWVEPKTDSAHWEIWDSRGKHVHYVGTINGNTVIGKRTYRGDVYQMVITHRQLDTLDVALTVTPGEGDAYKAASFNLWRKKP